MAKSKTRTNLLPSAAVRSASVTIPRAVATAKPSVKPLPVKKTLAKPTKKPTPRKLTSGGLGELERRATAALAKNRALARNLVRDIVRRKRRVEDDFHAIGRALRRLSDESLYRALGYDSFDALLTAEDLFSKTMAYKLMSVAGAYPAAKARELGIEKAYGLIAYAEATPAADLARTLAEGNPRIGNQSLNTISVRELADAVKRVRAATGAGRNPTGPEQEARRIAREVQRDLRARGAKSARASAKRIGGEWRIEIDLGVGEVGVLG